MPNSIQNNPQLMSQLMGSNPDNKANDATGLARAQQKIDENARELHAKFAPTDEYSPSSRGVEAAAAIERYQSSYEYSETMSFSLTTREGDQVSVDFKQMYAQYQEYTKQQSVEKGPEGARMFESREAMESTQFEEQFGFSVTGNLNEDELSAVFNLFEQVDELANSFFGGNIEEAFQKAVDLDVDMSQIQSFSIDMQRTETQTKSFQQAAAYQNVQQQPSEGQESIEGEAKPAGEVSDLPPYLQSMQDIIARMDDMFEEARASFDDMFAGVLSQRSSAFDDRQSWFDRVSGFHDMLAEAANLNKETMKPSGVEIDPLRNEPAVEQAKQEEQAAEQQTTTPSRVGEVADEVTEQLI